eukprot:m.1663427 g.1663427  ORF g.1663427 m.1663427 type:complete len:56 (-) comp136750_c0_seq1:1-168(-)
MSHTYTHTTKGRNDVLGLCETHSIAFVTAMVFVLMPWTTHETNRRRGWCRCIEFI